MKDIYNVLQEKMLELDTLVKQCEALKIAIALCEDEPTVGGTSGADVANATVKDVPKRMWP